VPIDPVDPRTVALISIWPVGTTSTLDVQEAVPVALVAVAVIDVRPNGSVSAVPAGTVTVPPPGRVATIVVVVAQGGVTVGLMVTLAVQLPAGTQTVNDGGQLIVGAGGRTVTVKLQVAVCPAAVVAVAVTVEVPALKASAASCAWVRPLAVVGR